MSKITRSWILAALVCFVAVWPLSGAGTTARPEEVGLSSERLQQVNALMKRHLDAGSFAGAVTLVARNGRIVHLQPHGMADLESKQPMKADSMFRIMSMTKPVVGVAILMMMEEGKVRLNDPVSKYYPEWKQGRKKTITIRQLEHGFGTAFTGNVTTTDSPGGTSAVRPARLLSSQTSTAQLPSAPGASQW